jgi:hypothetical protein
MRHASRACITFLTENVAHVGSSLFVHNNALGPLKKNVGLF